MVSVGGATRRQARSRGARARARTRTRTRARSRRRRRSGLGVTGGVALAFGASRGLGVDGFAFIAGTRFVTPRFCRRLAARSLEIGCVPAAALELEARRR